MELSLYDFVTLFLIVPLLFFTCTTIPAWLLAKARRMNTTLLLVLLAVLLIGIAAFLAGNLTQGMAVRCIAFIVALIACVLHYQYTKESKTAKDDDAARGGRTH